MRNVSTNTKDLPPVDRTRRFRFVSAVVTFCLIASAAFTLLVTIGSGVPIYNIGIVETFIGASMSLASMTTLAYITGSVIDYTAPGIFNRSTKASDYVLPATRTGAKG